MKALLDTHIILWILGNDSKLPEKAKEIFSDSENELYYSVVSMWEVSIKHSIHPDRMKISGSKFAEECEKMGILPIEISCSHVKALETLIRPDNVPPHNDPFDRIMIAQSKSEDLIFITHDSLIAQYNEPCIIYV